MPDALVAYVAQRTGMRLAGAQQRRVQRVLGAACSESGLTSAAFAELLRTRPEVFDGLVDDLTVGETYFFRERPQLEMALQAVRAEEGRPGRAARPVRAWSAGCSSGEEAYTLAMLLRGPAGTPDPQVLGTDISPRALAHAEGATYGGRALRVLSREELAVWFEPVRGGRFRVRERFGRAVRLQPRNLLDGPPQEAAFDLVLCRNVLIYLSPESVAVAAQALRDALVAGGWLLTGVADPILEVDGLERVGTRQGVLYRRAGLAPTGRPRLRDRPAPVPVTPGRLRPAVTSCPVSDRRLPPLKGEPVPFPAMTPGSGGATSPVRGRLLPDRQAPTMLPPDPSELATARRAVEAAPLDPGLRYRLALLHLERGDLGAAAESAGAAVFLEPALVVGHLLQARIFEALNDEHRAARCFRAAAVLLEQLPADVPIPHGDGETAAMLAVVVGQALGAGSRPEPGSA